MNKFKIIFLTRTLISVLLFSLVTPVIFTVFSFAQSVVLENFKFFKTIVDVSTNENNKKSNFKIIEIDPEIYNETRVSSPDIRIFDNKGKDIPFYKYSDFEVKNNDSIINFTPINRTKNGNNVSVTFKKDDINTLNEYNYLEVEISSSNYLLAPKVWGSMDGKTFSSVSTSSLIFNLLKDSPGNNSSKNSKIEFDTVNYPYLKIDFEIKSGTLDEYAITRGTFDKYWKYVAPVKKLNATILSTKNEKNITTLLVDISHTNIPLKKIALNVLDKSYYRQIEILSGKDTENFSSIGSGIIGSKDLRAKEYSSSIASEYSYEIGDSMRNNYPKDPSTLENEIRLNRVNAFRYIKIKIANKDNPPLNISGVEAFYTPEYLLFESSTNYEKPFKVYFGSQAYGYPEYDINYFVSKIKDKDTEKLSMSKMESNPTYKMGDIPFTDRNNLFITAAVIIAVLGMGYLVIRNLKNV